MEDDSEDDGDFSEEEVIKKSRSRKTAAKPAAKAAKSAPKKIAPATKPSTTKKASVLEIPDSPINVAEDEDSAGHKKRKESPVKLDETDSELESEEAALVNEPPKKRAPAKTAATKKAPAKQAAAKKAPAKKAPAKKTAAKKTTARKKNLLDDTDSENEDAFNSGSESDEPVAKPAPRARSGRARNAPVTYVLDESGSEEEEDDFFDSD